MTNTQIYHFNEYVTSAHSSADSRASPLHLFFIVVECDKRSSLVAIDPSPNVLIALLGCAGTRASLSYVLVCLYMYLYINVTTLCVGAAPPPIITPRNPTPSPLLRQKLCEWEPGKTQRRAMAVASRTAIRCVPTGLKEREREREGRQIWYAIKKHQWRHSFSRIASIRDGPFS